MGWKLCVSHWKLNVLVGHFVFRAGKLSVPMLFVFLDDSFAFLGVGKFVRGRKVCFLVGQSSGGGVGLLDGSVCRSMGGP